MFGFINQIGKAIYNFFSAWYRYFTEQPSNAVIASLNEPEPLKLAEIHIDSRQLELPWTLLTQPAVSLSDLINAEPLQSALYKDFFEEEQQRRNPLESMLTRTPRLFQPEIIVMREEPATGWSKTARSQSTPTP